MRSILRILTITRVIWVFGLYEFAKINDTKVHKRKKINSGFRKILFKKKFVHPRAVRIRKALEYLGPIFVKLGQVLSTRRDLLPEDIADELALLQDRVTPFDSDIAIKLIENSLGEKVETLFLE